MLRSIASAMAMMVSVNAGAQGVPPPSAPSVQQAAPVPLIWNPAAGYVTAGQDEPGYRSWYLALPSRAVAVGGFNDYLTTHGVGGVVPTWQLLRTASSWQRCGAGPFEVPPTAEWPNLVQTLRYVRDHVVPAIGPVEAVSVYRNPVLNICAGGVPGSAHRHFQAVDLVPLTPTTREALMETLCAAHLRQGSPYQVGLGFYAFLRFHVDTMRFRKWGVSEMGEASPCRVPIISPPAAGIDMPVEQSAVATTAEQRIEPEPPAQ